MADIGTAYVKIEPTAKGISGAIEKEFGAAGSTGASSFNKGFGSVVGGVGKTLGGMAAVGGAAVAAITTKFVSASGEVASYGDNIDKMSQKMGISATAYQEWDAVMQHSGTSMESLKSSMKTLATAAETGKDAFAELGITQEQIANMSQEDLFSATISALQNVDDETQRTYLAGQLLGRGATELGALLNTSAEETQAMKDRVHELGGVMSDDAVKASAAFQDQLQDMQTAFSGLGRNLMSEFLPDLTEVMAGLTEIFSGNSDKGIGMIADGISGLADKILDALPEIVKVGTEIIKALGDAIIQNLPTLVQLAVEVAVELGQALVDALPTLVEALVSALPLLIDGAIQLINGLVQALPEIMLALIEAIPQIIPPIVQCLVDNLPIFVEGLVALVTAIAEALPDVITAIIEVLPDLIGSIVDAILQCLPILIEGNIQLITALVAALPEIIAALIEAIPQIVQQVVDAFITNGPIILQALAQLGMTILQAVLQLGQTLITNVSQFFTNLMTTVKGWLSQLPEQAAYWVGAMIAKFITFLSQLPSKAQQVWSNFITNLKAFGQKMITEGPRMAREFGEKLIEKLKELPQKLIQVGKDIVEGLKNGIKEAWDSMTGWIGDLCSNFIKGFQDNLKIGSPSKVFRDEVGKWIPAGIAEGIEDGIGVLNSAMGDMTMAVSPAAMNGIQTYTPQSATVQNEATSLYELLNRYLPIIASGENVNVQLDVDGQRLFRVIQQQQQRNTQLVGVGANA